MRSSLGQKFIVDWVRREESFPCRLNIRKRIPQAVVRSSTANNVNLCYTQADSLTTEKNLYLADRSGTLPQNHITSDLVQTGTVKYLTLGVKEPLITDVFITESATQKHTPLFQVHKLTYFNDDLVDFVDRTLLSIQFLDVSFQPLSTSEYWVDAVTGGVYNNFANTFQSATGVVDVTYLQYAVKTPTTTTTYCELLSNARAYTEATFDDIDDTGFLFTGARAYIVELTAGSYKFTLPSTKEYAWKIAGDSCLKLTPPPVADAESPWYLSINDREVVSSQLVAPSSYRNFRYYIPEITLQTYDPYPPYRTILEELGAVITSRLVKVSHGITLDSAKNIHLTLWGEDEDGLVVVAYTTDSSLVGTIENGVEFEAGILSVDKSTGFVALAGDLPLTVKKVWVSYTTTDRYYSLTDYNFNPVHNLDATTEQVVFYVMPESLVSGPLTRSLYYLLVNRDNQIKYCSQTDITTGALDPVTSKLLREDFDITGVPKKPFYYDITSTVSGLESWYTDPDEVAISEFSFVDKYTVGSQLLDMVSMSGVSSLSADMLTNFQDNSRLLILGEVSTNSTIRAGDIEVLDTRLRGGGIIESEIDAALLLQPEVSWYHDMNLPVVYPGQKAAYVQVPHRLHARYGGQYNDDQLRSICHRHASAGHYEILSTYGVDPVIVGVCTWSGVVQVNWPSYGAGQTYRLRLSTDDQSWTTMSSSVDTGVRNIASLSGLSLGVRYFVRVEAENTIWEPGPSVTFEVPGFPITEAVSSGSWSGFIWGMLGWF